MTEKEYCVGGCTALLDAVGGAIHHIGNVRKYARVENRPSKTMRKPGTGCISEINHHLFEGRYSPVWPDGKKHARNVYAHTREECEEKLVCLIAEMKAEIAERKVKKNSDK